MKSLLFLLLSSLACAQLPGGGVTGVSAGSSGPTLQQHFSQSLGANGGATTRSGINITTSTKLELVKFAIYDPTLMPATVIDSAGNTLTRLGGTLQSYGASPAFVVWYYKFNPTTGTSVTWTVSASSSYMSVQVSLYSYSGTFSGSTETTINQASGTGASISPGATGSLNHTPNEVCEAATSIGGNAASTLTSRVFSLSDFTDWMAGASNGIGVSYLIPSSGASATPGFNAGVSVNYGAVVACFY